MYLHASNESHHTAAAHGQKGMISIEFLTNSTNNKKVHDENIPTVLICRFELIDIILMEV